MTATLAGSVAVLKTKYPKGKLPSAMHQKFPNIALFQRIEDFSGANKVIALQTENPQGSSVDFQTALGSLAQSQYYNFTLTRSRHFGIARIQGEAMEASKDDAGALVDLWVNEINGISQTELKCMEIYSFGNGSATLGQITAGVATNTITVGPDVILNFDLNMRVNVVSDATLAPVLRLGTVTITGINRQTGTLTISGAAWNVQVAGIVVGDFLTRAGDFAAGGINKVFHGYRSWIDGSATPGTLYGLNRNPDSTRLAGQTVDLTGVPLEDAIKDMEGLLDVQGQMEQLTLVANTKDINNLKKSLQGKATYEQANVKASVANVSFSAVQFDGNYGKIPIIVSPFCPRNQSFMIARSTWAIESLGPAPHLLKWDGPDFMRVASDDAYEVRVGSYMAMRTNMPVANIRSTGFGA
jgi:hypothetical protein